MKKAMLFAVALTALSSTLVQAADRLQVVTAVSVDGSVVKTMTSYVENGEKIHYSSTETREVVTNVTNGKPSKKLEPIGFEGDLTPRILSTGEIRITTDLTYAGFKGEHTERSGGSDIEITDFWRHKMGGVVQGDLGKPLHVDLSTTSRTGHIVDVVVTVTRS